MSALFPVSRNLFAQTAPGSGGQVEVKNGLCRACHFANCTLRYTVKDGVLSGVEGSPEGPYNQGKACVRGLSVLNYLYNPYRIKTPLKRTNPQKGLDVDPGWVEISWEEALDTLIAKLKPIRDGDRRKLVWMNGFPSYLNTITGRGTVYPGVFGTPNTLNPTSSLCSVHLGNAIVQGGTVQWPDFEHTKYCIALGGTFGPNHAAADGGTDYVLDAVERGAKFVVIDPYCSPEAKLGEWVPIRPGTDLTYLLALGHVILHEIGRYDEWFLKNRSTGPYLIAADGSDYQRDPESKKPLIWDPAANRAKVFDDPTIQDYALEGSYTAGGTTVKPAFTWLKEGLSVYTPEWAEEICTIPAATIRRHAAEFIDAARIGSTIDINGFSFPLRPACTYVARGACNHYDGHVTMWMAAVINQLVGAVAVPGGNLNLAESPELLKPNEDGVVTREDRMSHFHPFQIPPSRIDAPEFVPFAFGTAAHMFDVMLDPEKYGMDYLPEVLVNVGANLMTKGSNNPERLSNAFRKIPFMFSYSYHMDEHTVFSDLVLPDMTYLEQTTIYNYKTIRPGHGRLVDVQRGHKPIVKPLYNQRIPDDVWIEVAERLGFLYGPGPNLNFVLNMRYALKPQFALDLTTKYRVEEINDRILQSGHNVTLDEFVEKGFATLELKPEEEYSYYYYPDNKTRHPLYNVYFRHAGDQMLEGLKKHGMRHPGLTEEDIRFYYSGVPAWKATPMQRAPEEFDLYGVLRRIPQLMFDITAVSSNPWLQETAAQNPHFGKLLLNTATARRKGLADGDMVYVEGCFGGKIGPYPIKTTELIHPDAMGVLSGESRLQTGMNPVTQAGIAYNRILPDKWETNDVFTGGIDVSPRVKLTRV